MAARSLGGVDLVPPRSSSSASDAIVLSVISPAGVITDAARGFSSLAANSANDPAPSAPSTSSALTASGVTS